MATPAAPVPEWTWSDLATINAAIANGVREVRFQDRTEVFASGDDLIKRRSIIWLYLHPGKVRQLLTYSRKGW